MHVLSDLEIIALANSYCHAEIGTSPVTYIDIACRKKMTENVNFGLENGSHRVNGISEKFSRTISALQ